MRLMQVVNSENKKVVLSGRCAGKSIPQNMIAVSGRNSAKEVVAIVDELKEEKPAKRLAVKLISKAIRQALRGY